MVMTSEWMESRRSLSGVRVGYQGVNQVVIWPLKDIPRLTHQLHYYHSKHAHTLCSYCSTLLDALTSCKLDYLDIRPLEVRAVVGLIQWQR